MEDAFLSLVDDQQAKPLAFSGEQARKSTTTYVLISLSNHEVPQLPI